MAFKLRIARTWRDLELVALLDHILFVNDGCHALESHELHRQDVVWWLAEADGVEFPVGFCGMSLSKKYETSFIRAATMPEHRRKGLQKQMILARLEYARKAGYTTVQTYVHGDNVASTKALLSCGFVPHKASKNKREGLWLYVQASTAKPKVKP